MTAVGDTVLWHIISTETLHSIRREGDMLFMIPFHPARVHMLMFLRERAILKTTSTECVL